MEYLPEKKRTQQAQVRKKEAKLKDFREFLADKEVVLALVKCKYIPTLFVIMIFLCRFTLNEMPERITSKSSRSFS